MIRLCFFLGLFLYACSSSTKEIDVKKEELPKEEISLDAEPKKKAQAPNAPFDKLQFDKVVAFDFNPMGQREKTIYSRRNGYSEQIFNKKELSISQSKTLENLLTDSSTFGGSTAACFIPNWGLVFYNKEKVAFVVDVCLDCNYLESSPEIAASRAIKDKLDDDSEIVRFGFSIKGQQAIIDLCKELGMKYGRKVPNKMFEGK